MKLQVVIVKGSIADSTTDRLALPATALGAVTLPQDVVHHGAFAKGFDI